MAIDPELLIIKTVPELGTDNEPNFILSADGENKLVKTSYTALKSQIVSGSKGEATPTSSPTPWAPGDPDLFEKWDIKTPGTYTNFKDASNNPIVVTADDLDGKLVQIWVTNGVSKLEISSMPQATQNIPKFQDLTFPALEGKQAIYEDKLWQVKPGQTAAITDLPSEATTSKWTLIGESVTQKSSNTVVVKTDALTSNQYFTDSDHFAGFGFLFTALKDFNQSIIKIGQIVGTSKPVTQVNLRICEDSYTGTELLRVNKTVSITEGDIQDVIFDHALIANAANKSLWVEFWTNGKTGLFKGNSSPTVPFKYKSDTMPNAPTNGFNTNSADGASPTTRFYLALNKTSNEIVLKDELVTEEIAIGNERPPKSNAVAEKLAQYDNVIADAFINDTVTTLGTTSINTNNTAIRGWGQLKGVLTDFNRVGFKLRPFDAGFIPTQVKCIIRKTSNTTEPPIFNQTKNVSLQLNVATSVYFDLSSTFVNTNNDEIFVSFTTNGAVTLLGGSVATDFDAAHAVKYTATSLSDTLNSTNSNLKHQLYCEIIKGHFVKQVSDSETARIRGYNTPDLLLTSRVWLYPGFQYNVYDKNVCVPMFGDNLENYRLNWEGSIGKQLKRGFRLDNIPASLNQSVNLSLMRGRDVLVEKVQNILSTSASNGSGLTRKVLVIGDSTVDNNYITSPLKTVFDSDAMHVTFLGTRGATNTKHEGRGGWTIADYYGPGRTLYAINVAGLAVPPGINARYTQGANTYNVEEVNISGGSGYFSVSIVSGSAPTASGTLTKTSGSGDFSITYSSMNTTPGNPFYYSTTGKFDLGYYLSSTSQTMGDNDWIFFQLGINDMFSSMDLSNAQLRATNMITQLKDIILNIHTYNANIRIGLIVTFPPADQNAFGETYSNFQLSEMYRKTGLVTWQKKLIEEFDNTTSINAKTYLVSAHLAHDADNNSQVITRPVNSRNSNMETIESNGVHPLIYEQITDMYAGIIKYFG